MAFCHGVSEFCLRKHAWLHRQTHFQGWKYVRLSAAVLDRQPDRGLVRGRRGHAVLLVGLDVDVVPGPHLHDPVLKLQPGGTLEHDHPLAGRLVIPEAIGGLVAVRDDSLDADSGGLQERREEFLGAACWASDGLIRGSQAITGNAFPRWSSGNRRSSRWPRVKELIPSVLRGKQDCCSRAHASCRCSLGHHPNTDTR